MTHPDPPAIRITVLLHSILRHREGRIMSRLELDLPSGSRVADVLRRLEVDEALEPIVAVNGVVAAEEAVLQDGDQVAVIPSVAGG
jgi:molybdopterin converting factor small subunit